MKMRTRLNLFNRYFALVFLFAILSAGSVIAAEDAILDKTFVIWTTLSNLTQQGGSLLALEDTGDDSFDAIVFGEIAGKRWSTGSEHLTRCAPSLVASWAEETASPETLVQLAVVYRGNDVRLYRNGSLYGEYTTAVPQKTFTKDSVVVMGPRHRRVPNKKVFAGSIADARIYSTALTQEQIQVLKPGVESEIKPFGWWNFISGKIDDITGNFPHTVLSGGAKIINGKLYLDGKRTAFQAYRQPVNHDQTAQTMNDHLTLRAPGAVGDGGYVKTLPALNKSQRVLRDMLLRDPYRPTFHLVAPEAVCAPFDPNGAIFWNNRYHLYYIFQDERGHCWGHVSSHDLVHWRWHTPDIAPTPDGPDTIMFSGSTMPTGEKGKAAIIWPGGCGQCLMTSTDKNLDVWEKSSLNPVAPFPTQAPFYAMGDPHSWFDGKTYYMIGGGQRAVPSLLKTDDLNKRFEYVGNFMKHDLPEVEPWEDTSCPDFFPLRNKWVFMCLNHDKGVRYYVGRWENEQFVPEKVYRLNYPGGCFYASESLESPDGRRVFWGWIDDLPYENIELWSGIMSLPRVLDLEKDGLTPILTPAVELEQLRTAPQKRANLTIKAGQEITLPEMSGDSKEFRLRIESRDDVSCGLKIRCSNDGREETPVYIDLKTQTVRIGLEKASLKNPTYRTYLVDVFHPGGSAANSIVSEQIAPLEMKKGEIVELRIFIDKSVLEVFVNNRICLTQMIYPTLDDSVGVKLFSQGGDAEIIYIESWDMAPSVPW